MQILLAWPPSIFADLKSFGMPDLAALSAPYHFSSAARMAGVTSRFGVVGQPVLAGRRILGHLIQLAIHPGQPFVDLRDVRVERIDFLVEHVVDARSRRPAGTASGFWKWSS